MATKMNILPGFINQLCKGKTSCLLPAQINLVKHLHTREKNESRPGIFMYL